MYHLPNPGLFHTEFWDKVLKETRLLGLMLAAGSLPPPPPPLPHPGQPGPSEGRFPSPSGISVNPDTLPATGPTGNHPTPPQTPGVNPETHSLLNPEPFPTEFWDKVLKGKFKRRVSGSDAMNLAQKDTRS